ncbi:TPA: DUF551 domain-containing protein [Pasteurella multocida]|uniref:DUF551 domain-containing protein n=3 Tax=Pasteurella multocida TaxID=747 RepID=UPI000353D487|nr:DUF551 domain-containing protein [Pasteurella multocida]ANJ89289.1 hypothetical protein PMCN01_0040 [Pasteurella multocida subsp. multocida HB01]AON58485.1 hypothetical protein AZI96_07015 [Pasteurella multocida]AUK28683.1 hypothetical protein A4205_08405 [Pasteurella multocida]AUK33828.1 hypothetical protein A4201_02670 [Pasteurella multocida]AUK49121.1 hypothetical protein A4210_04925 [Pasteurella multocida]
MTEKENKYFAVNIYDENSISFHKTEEEAKKACLNCAEEFHQQCADGQDMQCYEDRISHAIYGVILGKAESKTRELSEEEKQSGLYDGIDCMVELPEIVEFPQDDGWISVKDKLPKKFDRVLVCQQDYKWEQNYIRIAYCNNSEGTEWWADNYDGTGCEIIFNDVTHWRPLPPPPKTE